MTKNILFCHKNLIYDCRRILVLLYLFWYNIDYLGGLIEVPFTELWEATDGLFEDGDRKETKTISL